MTSRYSHIYITDDFQSDCHKGSELKPLWPLIRPQDALRATATDRWEALSNVLSLLEGASKETFAVATNLLARHARMYFTDYSEGGTYVDGVGLLGATKLSECAHLKSTWADRYATHHRLPEHFQRAFNKLDSVFPDYYGYTDQTESQREEIGQEFFVLTENRLPELRKTVEATQREIDRWTMPQSSSFPATSFLDWSDTRPGAGWATPSPTSTTLSPFGAYESGLFSPSLSTSVPYTSFGTRSGANTVVSTGLTGPTLSAPFSAYGSSVIPPSPTSSTLFAPSNTRNGARNAPRTVVSTTEQPMFDFERFATTGATSYNEEECEAYTRLCDILSHYEFNSADGRFLTGLRDTYAGAPPLYSTA